VTLLLFYTDKWRKLLSATASEIEHIQTGVLSKDLEDKTNHYHRFEVTDYDSCPWLQVAHRHEKVSMLTTPTRLHRH